MSLQNLLYGYTGGECVLESVEPELTAVYNCDEGPVLMALEAADALHEIFMEAFYDTNDIEISAALEGVSIVNEATGKGSSFKDKIKSAWGKLKELFMKFVNWLKGIFSSIVKSIKDHCTKIKNFFKSIPDRLKSVEYEGYKYSHVDEYAKFAANVSTSSKNFTKVADEIYAKAKKVTKNLGEGESVNQAELGKDYDEILKKHMNALKGSFGIKEDDAADKVSAALFAFFRSGAKTDSPKTKQKISINDAKKAVDNSEKNIANIDKMFKNLQASYQYQADNCAALERQVENSDLGNPQLQSATVNGIRKVASYSNSLNSFVSTVTNAWKTAMTERDAAYASALKSVVNTDLEVPAAESYGYFESSMESFGYEGYGDSADLDDVGGYVSF